MIQTEQIDPQLPYIQVHRSIGPKAAQLAPVLNLSYQHVRGALTVFWEHLADRRRLTRALALPEPAILLDEAECRMLLHLAFGVKVEPEVLVGAGVLEPTLGELYRVRGMSRYLNTEAGRVTKKGSRPFGPDKRATRGRPESDPSPTPVAPELPPSPTPVAPESHPTEARGERLDLKALKGDLSAAQPLPAKPKAAPAPVEVGALKDGIDDAFKRHKGKAYRWSPKDEERTRVLLGMGTVPEVLERWGNALQFEKFPVCASLADLITHWNHYAQPPAKKQSGAAKETDWGRVQPKTLPNGDLDVS